MTDIIRVEKGKEVSPGIWLYKTPSSTVEGRSHQPLLDACRKLKSIGVEGTVRVGLFREGKVEPDLVCSVAWGAEHSVFDDVRGVRFGQFKPFSGKGLNR